MVFASSPSPTVSDWPFSKKLSSTEITFPFISMQNGQGFCDAVYHFSVFTTPDIWQQSGVVKTLKWYTASQNPCPFCIEMNGKVISVDDNFFENGQSLTVGEGDDAKTMSLDYGDVGSPPLHPNCFCLIRPSEISID